MPAIPDRHVTEAHYTGFGMIINIAAHIDSLLDQMVIAMAGGSALPSMYPLLTFMSAKDKRDYLVAMAKISTWPTPVIKYFERLMERAKSAFSVRNDVAHSTWKAGRRPGTIKPISLSARAVLRVLGSDHNEREWTAKELAAEAEKTYALGREISAFMDRFGLSLSLPEIPTPRRRSVPDRKRGTHPRGE